jgi:hypothetical protein
MLLAQIERYVPLLFEVYSSLRVFLGIDAEY